jgi:hypothetical protein
VPADFQDAVDIPGFRAPVSANFYVAVSDAPLSEPVGSSARLPRPPPNQLTQSIKEEPPGESFAHRFIRFREERYMEPVLFLPSAAQSLDPSHEPSPMVLPNLAIERNESG